MLNTFPTLLSLSFFAPLILRLTLGVIFLIIGYITIFKKRGEFEGYFKSKNYPLANFLPLKFGIAEIIVGIFLILGFYTQIVSLISIYILLSLLFIERKSVKILPYTAELYIVLSIVALTLLITGAGIWAIDLPL